MGNPSCGSRFSVKMHGMRPHDYGSADIGGEKCKECQEADRGRLKHMKYYRQTENDTVRMLMEVLEMQAKDKNDWTLQEIFALCRDLSFIDDVPLNADYFDSTYLILAELYTEFRRYGQMAEAPDGLWRVHSFTMNEAAKRELLSALTALQSGKINGRTRALIAEWEKEDTLQEWQQHIGELITEIMEVLPDQSGTNPDEAAIVPESLPEKKKQRGKVATVLLLICSLLFTWFSLYLMLYGAIVTCNFRYLHLNGAETAADGAVALVFGLLIFVGVTALSRRIFASLGVLGGILSVSSKIILLLLAFGMLVYLNIESFYRYFPAQNEDYCVNDDGVMVSRKDRKPYSGLLHDYEDGSLSVYSYKDGLLDGLNVVYDDGMVKEIGHWRAGKQDGVFMLYTDSGILIDYGNFKNGERHGLTRQYDYETGVISVEGNYNNGQLEGVWTQYYPFGGVAMVQTYQDGVLNGAAQQYYENGQLQIDMNYVEGIPEGPYKMYYPGGQIQVEGTLEDGEYGSDVKMYTEDGSLMESHE